MESTLPTLSRHEFFRLVGTGVGAILLSQCAMGCGRESADDPAPGAARKIDFTVNLNDKVYENLRVKGGYVVVSDVIVAQTKDGNFVAVSANCTHAGTQLTYKSADNQFYCPLHLSRFDTTGKVLVGPATQSLKQYTVVPNLGTGMVRVFGD